MTNIQIYLAAAVARLEAGDLNSREADFVERIKDFDKKELRSLSSAQLKWLRDIAS